MTVETNNVTPPGAGLAIRPGQDMWTAKQRAALAVLGIRDASNADLAVFMHYCQRTGLDPFSRQIYLIKRREKVAGEWVDKWTIQVGIDGFRVIRDRIAGRLGVTVEYEDTIWYDADGNEHAVWLRDDEPPVACKVTVRKDGRRFPGVVRTAAYAATSKEGDLVAQWRNQPDHMIEKCAEAFALRRAFPHDLGGIYIEEELPGRPGTMQATASNGGGMDAVAAQAAARAPTGDEDEADLPLTEATRAELDRVFAVLGWSGPETRRHRQVVAGVAAAAEGDPPVVVRRWRDLTEAEGQAALTALNGLIASTAGAEDREESRANILAGWLSLGQYTANPGPPAGGVPAGDQTGSGPGEKGDGGE